MRPLIVIKVGTSAITRPDGSLDKPGLVALTRQLAILHEKYRVILVSSGAVGAGRRFITDYSGNLAQRKAAAAIGNPILIQAYANYLEPYDITVAQSLCERRHFSNRDQFLQLRDTFEALWAEGVIPIANENDVVSNLELRFSDNDELATLLAVGFGAEKLLLGTSVPGVLDEQDQVVPVVRDVNSTVLSLARKETSLAGLGGMVSKLTFARLATRMGIETVIFGLREPDSVLKALTGTWGTRCLPQKANFAARKKWLASGSLVTGRLIIDEGAAEALLQRRASLLAVGLTGAEGDFEKGEVVEIARDSGDVIAVGRSRLSAVDARKAIGKKKMEVVHADEIVLL